MGVTQATRSRDIYGAAMAAALRRAARRIRRRCCAVCGVPAETITCTRPACWQALMALPDLALDELLEAYAFDRRPALTRYQRALITGIRLAGLALVVTLFGVLLYPALRLLAGEAGR